MFKGRLIWLAMESWFVLSVCLGLAQGAPASGIYRITSGEYRECCGIAGPLIYALPDQNQAFVQLTIDSQRNVAEMSFLGDDMHTVFRTGYGTSEFTFSFT